KIGLPGVERLATERNFDLLEELGLPDDDAVDAGYVSGFQEFAPADGGRHRGDLVEGHRVVILLRVAQVLELPRGAGQLGFEAHDRGCISGSAGAVIA